MNEAVATNTFWELAKYPVIVLLVIYLAFTAVIVKQVKLMIETLEVGFERPILLIAYAHLFLSMFVLLFSIIVL